MIRTLPARSLDAERAWTLVRGLADRARGGAPVSEPGGIRLDGARIVEASDERADVLIRPGRGRGWARPPGAPAFEPDVEVLFDLYVPLCVGRDCASFVIGHLGQSLDGRIATRCGDSQFITGQENLEHSHRMRALFDAVLVGSRTVEHDDPQLTTRLVPGDNATRIVLDATRRLGTDYRLFRDDAAPTLLVCAASAAGTGRHGCAEVVGIADDGAGAIRTEAIVAELERRGLGRVFIEGGGVTVSRFLQAGFLDRLHVAVAPIIFGSGRPAFSLPVIESLDEAMVFECRHFASGTDVLFDCVVGARPGRS